MASSKQLIISDLISIITPCYNQGEFLNEALASVLAQTYKNWECIIVNDGSTDDTEKIALDHTQKDSRFKYLYKENGGLSSARNAGIFISKGKYILPLDADDIIGDEYLTLGMAAFKETNDLKLVYCLAKKFGAENKLWYLQPYNYKNLLFGNCIFCSAIFRKNDWEQAGGYDEDLIYGLEDWMFWLKILNENSLVYQIPLILFFYRVKLISMSTSMTNSYIEMVNWRAFETYLPAYKKYFPAPQTLINFNIVYAEANQKVLNSYSYKLGNALIRPISYLKQLTIKANENRGQGSY
jgi:glycosyltransferase involved in cell wall biosynthesis